MLDGSLDQMPLPRSMSRPAHAQHLAATRAGKQQQPDGVGRLPVGVVGERGHQPPQFVAGEVSPSMVLPVALDALARVRFAHAPAHREREHLRHDRDAAVGGIRRAAARDLPVQRVDVGEGDVGDLGVLAEVRADVVVERAPVLLRRDLALARQVLGLEPVDQFGDRRRVALGLLVGERIAAASISRRSSFALARAAVVPQSGMLADGEAAVAAPDVVVQDEGPHALGRDADAEAPGLAVEGDRVALLRWLEFFDDGVRQPLFRCHVRVRSMFVSMSV